LSTTIPPILIAQSPVSTVAPQVEGTNLSADQARATIQSLVDMAIRQSPRRFEGTKNWEKTKKVWAGVKFGRSGLRMTTKRRWREVRHGLQTRYRVGFPGGQETPRPLVANIGSVTRSEGGQSNRPGWVIQCALATPLDFTARIERWNRGVQWYSIEVSGHMDIRLDLSGRLSSYPDYSDIPPAIIIDPQVTSASLHLDALHVDRVSKIGGEVAEQWGELAEKIVREILLDDFNDKLPTKLNQAIDKKRDRLRFSASDWVSSLTTK
jgi:hypothetical protein